jgi:hypothetical protein
MFISLTALINGVEIQTLVNVNEIVTVLELSGPNYKSHLMTQKENFNVKEDIKTIRSYLKFLGKYSNCKKFNQEGE